MATKRTINSEVTDFSEPGGLSAGDDGVRTNEVVASLSESSSLRVLTSSDPPNFGERFVVEETLGAGGMAAVYRVLDKELDKRFACKVFLAERGRIDIARIRLERESKALIELEHPNIARIHGHSETVDGQPYMILEWIEGRTLSELIAEEPISEGRAIGIFMQISDALQHAHMNSVIHRDLKPGNIIVKTDEHGNDLVKIIDFGIASALEDDTTADSGSGKSDSVGTPLYMSPEQTRGERIDGRSDIYSFGCLMYEVLTGTPPFKEENSIKLLLKKLKEKPPSVGVALRARAKSSGGRAASVTPALESLVMQCLELEPAKRYQLIDELLQDLVNIRNGRERQFSFSDLKAPFALRFIASCLDGLLLSGFYLFLWNTLSVLTGVPFPESQFGLFSTLLFAIPFFGLSLYTGPAIAVLVLLAILQTPSDPSRAYFLTQYGLFFFTFLLSPIYFASFESSRLQATPGKFLMNQAVVDSAGRRLSFSHAFMRSLSRFLYLRGVTFEQGVLPFVQKLKHSVLSNLHNNFNFMPYVAPIVDDFVGAHVVKRCTLRVPHELQLRESINLESLSVEKLHQINRACTGNLCAALSFFLIASCCVAAEISMGEGHCWSAIFLLMLSIQTSPDLYLTLKVRRLIKRKLRVRQEEAALTVLQPEGIES